MFEEFLKATFGSIEKLAGKAKPDSLLVAFEFLGRRCCRNILTEWFPE
jgi:hypothetical protein